MRERVAMIMLVALAACAPGVEEMEPGGAAEAAALASSLQAEVGPDSVAFTLAVTNAGGGPVVLEFGSAQAYDFVVRDAAGGAEVWRWSADRVFAQVVTADTVEEGGTRMYRAAWGHGGRSGEYVVTGALTSTNQSLELHTRLAVPAR